jgi:hypothetical protein
VAAHRYWRIRVLRNNGGTSSGQKPLVVTEVEMRVTPSGADQCSGGTAFGTAGHFSAGDGPDKAFDNNTATYWQPTMGLSSSDVWTYAICGYDFGSGNDKDIVEVTMAALSGFMSSMPNAFYVESSDDNATWNLEWFVICGTWANTTPRVFTKPSIDNIAPYWALVDINTFTPNSQNIAAVELEFYENGVDVTSGGTGFMSPQFTSFPVANAYDGNLGTASACGTYNGNWIGYHFTSDVTIDRFDWTGNTGGTSVQSCTSGLVMYSDDGISFLPAWTFNQSIAYASGERRSFWQDNPDDVNDAPLHAMAVKSAAESIGTSLTVMSYGTVVEDSIGALDLSQSATSFIAQSIFAGRYGRFGFNAHLNSGIVEGETRRNGSTFLGGGKQGTESTGTTMINAHSAPVLLSAGDAFSAYIRNFVTTGNTQTNERSWGDLEIMPTGYNGALVNKTTGQSITNVTTTPITWDAESYDLGGWHSTSVDNSRLTVPSGVTLVRVQANIEMPSGTAQTVLGLTKNGSSVPGAFNGDDQYAASRVRFLNGMSAPLAVTPGDYFEATVYNSTGSQSLPNGNHSWMSIHALPDDLSYALVTKSSDQALSAATNTLMDWATEVADVGGWFNSGVSATRFVVPPYVSHVRLTLNIVGADNSSQLVASILKNGNIVAGTPGQESMTEGQDFVNLHTGILAVETGDYFEANVFSTDARNVTATNYTWFSIEAVAMEEPTSEAPSEEPTSEAPSEPTSEAPTSEAPSEPPSEPTSEAPSEPTSEATSEAPSEPTSEGTASEPVSEPTSEAPTDSEVATATETETGTGSELVTATDTETATASDPVSETETATVPSEGTSELATSEGTSEPVTDTPSDYDPGPGPFYFAWAVDGDPTWSPAFIRRDEDIFSMRIRHGEGDFPVADIEIRNPRVGLLAGSRKQWAWLSYRPAGQTEVVPLMLGRVVGVPQALQNEGIVLTLVARPEDYTEQKEALAESLRTLPLYDPVWLSEEERIDPDKVFEARAELWHIDRVTHVVTNSNIIQDSAPAVVPEYVVPYDSIDVSYSTSPARRAVVTAEVGWVQTGTGILNLRDHLLQAFKSITPAAVSNFKGSPTSTNGYIATLAGEQLRDNWPDPGRRIGGGWSVGPVSQLDLIGPAPLPPASVPSKTWDKLKRATPGTTPRQNQAYQTLSSIIGRNPGYAVQVVNHSASGESDDADTVDIVWFPIWKMSPQFTVQWNASRSYSETMSFTISADVQSLLSDPGDEDTIHIGLGPVYVDEFLTQSLSRTWFKTPRGKQSLENLIARARTQLLARARSIDLSFQTTFDYAASLSCRSSLTLADPRLPGGVATGKVKAYELSIDGDSGEMIATVTIGCTAGRTGTIPEDGGQPVYVADDYVDHGYQVYAEAVVMVGTDIGYSGVDETAINDDGQVLTDVSLASHLEDLGAGGGLTIQQTNLSLGTVNPNAVYVIDRVNGIEVEVWAEMKPVTGGPFATEFAPTMTELKVPRTIDLEAE